MIPLSKITIKYTSGDLLKNPITSFPYKGYYMESIDGAYYEGDNNMSLLIPLVLIEGDTEKNINPTRNVRKWNIMKSQSKDFLANTISVPSMKVYPSKKNYNDGYIIRYFSKRINNSLYQEIEKNVYDSISKQDKKYDHNLHEIGQIKWYLTKNVFKTNSIELKKTELLYPNISHLFPLLNEFFQPEKTKENLYTEGEELYTADGEEYIGFYHIHSSQGPMIGKYHTGISHQRLYYTNQLPTPGGVDYETWLASQYNPTHPPIPNRDNNITSGNSQNISYNCNVLWIPASSDYGGITDENGLIPGGTQCVDPGDGTGLYSYAEYGMNALQTCNQICSNTNLDPNALGIGCLYSFDPNYCGSCSQHHEEACGSGPYYTYHVGCICGVYNDVNYYSHSCCLYPNPHNPDIDNPVEELYS